MISKNENSLADIGPLKFLWNDYEQSLNPDKDFLNGNLMPFVHLRFGRYLQLYTIRSPMLDSFLQDSTGNVTLTFYDPTNFYIERLLRFIFTFKNERDSRLIYIKWGWTNGQQEWSQGENVWMAFTLISFVQTLGSQSSRWTMVLSPYALHMIQNVKIKFKNNISFDKITEENFENFLKENYINKISDDLQPRIKVSFIGDFEDRSLVANDGWYQTDGGITFDMFLKGIVQKRWIGLMDRNTPSIYYSTEIVEEEGKQQPLTTIFICDNSFLQMTRVKKAIEKNTKYLSSQEAIDAINAVEKQYYEETSMSYEGGMSGGNTFNISDFFLNISNNYSDSNASAVCCDAIFKWPNVFSGILDIAHANDLQWTDKRYLDVQVIDVDAKGIVSSVTSETLKDTPPSLQDEQLVSSDAETTFGSAGQTSTAPDVKSGIGGQMFSSPYYGTDITLTLMGEPDICDPLRVIGANIYLFIDTRAMIGQFLPDFDGGSEDDLQRIFPSLQSASITGIVKEIAKSGIFKKETDSLATGVYSIRAFSNEIKAGIYKTTLTLGPVKLKLDNVY